MRKVLQFATLGALLAITLLSGSSCDEPAQETVAPVQIAPSDESRVPAASSIEQLRVRVVAKYPHARDAFTQGLLWHDGAMYESTGRYGRSSLRRVRLEDGEVLAERSLDPSLFGEGLALVDDRLVQLTWRSGVAVVSDLESLEQRDMLRYPGEGWGLCFDGTALVMSDGSSILDLRSPQTLELLSEMTVWRGDRPVRKLNELECVGDDLYANVWQSNEIMRIDAKTGRVTAVIDASGLLTASESMRADVLNGIAYKPDTDTFLLTGKLWPHVFEVDLVPR
jgi:glutaminyl-peptide cyclotransferase